MKNIISYYLMTEQFNNSIKKKRIPNPKCIKILRD